MLEKYIFRTKEFLKTTIGKSVIVIGLVSIGTSAFIIPTILSKESTSNISAYNRDSNSGTYSVWTSFLDKSNESKWSKNAKEVTGNDKMLSYINTNSSSIGYVSAESVDYHSVADNEKPITKNNISNTTILNFVQDKNNIQEPSSDNIRNDNYGNDGNNSSLTRGFNQFWRGSSKLDKLFDGNVNEFINSTKDAKVNKMEEGAWVFYNWTLFGSSVESALDEASSFALNRNVTMTDSNLIEIIEGLQINEINFTTVGSTSVSGTLSSLINEFSLILKDSINVNINFSGHDGSGDAFKYTGIFDNSSLYIGYQSRNARAEEYSKETKWNNHIISDPRDINSVHYQTYSIDPLILLINSNGSIIKDSTNNKVKIIGVSKYALNLIYLNQNTTSFTWQTLYDFIDENQNLDIDNHIQVEGI